MTSSGRVINRKVTSNQLRRFNSGTVRGEKRNFPKEIREGQKVKLDVETIKNKRVYRGLTEHYRDFVEESAGKEFTAHVEHDNLISFKEEPKWLFWSGELIRVDDEADGENS